MSRVWTIALPEEPSGGVSEGERGVDAHCSDCAGEWRGYTEAATWTLAAQHVRDTGHGVMMHWRLFLSPAESSGG